MTSRIAAPNLVHAIDRALALTSSIPGFGLRLLLIAEIKDCIAEKGLELTSSGKLSYEQMSALIEFIEDLIKEM